MKFDFEVSHSSSKSKARRGRITTPHGVIETPTLVTVGTKGTVKSLTPEDLELTNTQFVFANTYHLVLSPTLSVLKKSGGIHNFSKINRPIITDSGGFQVFSLARNKSVSRGVASLSLPECSCTYTPGEDEKITPTLVKIDDSGVTFRSHYDGSQYVFTPEFSINAQKIIGADFTIAFDECVYLGASEKYTKRSLARTHNWAERSIVEFKKKSDFDQKMYGVIQGGVFKSLRQASANFIASLPFWGLAIGGISVGETKNQMRDQASWVMDVIAKDKRPIHALGIGHLDDIVDMIALGIDTFDCVVPTRDARIGKLYVSKDKIDITKSQFKSDLSPIDRSCNCYACQNYSRAYLHHLFKQRELLAYRLATIHNLFFMENFFRIIRNNIEEGLI